MRKLISSVLLVCVFTNAMADEADDSATYERVVDSVVMIAAFDGNWNVGYGSGVLIDADKGEILTAYHVIAPDKPCYAFFPLRGQQGLVTATNEYFPKRELHLLCEFVGKDPKRDLAILRLKAPVPKRKAVSLAASSPKPGQAIFAIGSAFPSGPLWRFAGGNVRQVYQDSFKFAHGQEIAARVVEHTVPTNGGDSGGPVLNRAGELVGITSCRYETLNQVQKAIDITEIRAFLDEAHKTEPRRPLFGTVGNGEKK
jgi:S1-C subfamily serine protease